MDAKGIKYTDSDVYKTFGVTPAQGKAAKAGKVARTHHGDPLSFEQRGEPRALSEKNLELCKHIIDDFGFEGHNLTWEQVAYEANLDISARTLQKELNARGYMKCIACDKPWIHLELAKVRYNFAKHMLERYPKPEDWEHVRFSDEVHFGWGPQRKLRIIRKQGQRHCMDCLQRREIKDDAIEEGDKRVHAWAAVGFNFKTPLLFYDIPSNTNGKMTQQAYISQILEPVVSKWCKEPAARWTLEEDRDSGHGVSTNSVVEQWKHCHGMHRNQGNLRFYFNAPQSPELSIIEACWQSPKQYVRTVPHYDNETLRELADEGWSNCHPDFINKLVHDMPRRLKDVRDSEGQMAAG